MEIIDTYRKYKKFGIKPKVLESYSNGPDHILFNDDDKELDTIRVNLPPTPDWNEIEGFGLPIQLKKAQKRKVKK